MRRHTWLLLTIAFIAYSLLLLRYLDAYPLEFYDESRRAVNAYEMAFGVAPDQHPIIPTYGGAPDNWGTKPPLLVWVQALLMRLIGPGELAVRLVSSLAGTGLFGLLCWFAVRQFSEIRIGALSAIVLATSPLFLGNHSVRSGDYDALLTLWLTGSILFCFQYLQTHKNKWLFLSALFLVLGGWTKGIAGLFYAPTILLLYLYCNRSLRTQHILRSGLAYFLAGVGIATYYYWREQLQPGFLALVWENELGGRYLEAKEIAPTPWHFYFDLIWDYRYFWPWLFFLPYGSFAMYSAGEKERKVLGLCLTAIANILLVMSFSGTKHYWYIFPALVPAAYLCGYGLFSMLRILQQNQQQLRGVLPYLFLLGLLAGPYVAAWEGIADYAADLKNTEQLAYGREMEYFADRAPYSVVVKDYSAPARFYTYLAQHRGPEVDIVYQSNVDPILRPAATLTTALRTGARILVCEQAVLERLRRGFVLAEIGSRDCCRLFRVDEILDSKPRDYQ